MNLKPEIGLINRLQGIVVRLLIRDIVKFTSLSVGQEQKD